MKLTLPWPPSANSYYRVKRNLRCSQCGGTVKVQPPYLTKKAHEFRRRVIAAAAEINPFGTARVAVRVDWFPPQDRGDIDNYTKPLLDALEIAGVFDDDAQVKDLRLVWRHPVKGGRAEVKLWEIEHVRHQNEG